MIAKVCIFFHSAKCLDKKIEGRSRRASPQLVCCRIGNPYIRYGSYDCKGKHFFPICQMFVQKNRGDAAVGLPSIYMLLVCSKWLTFGH